MTPIPVKNFKWLLEAMANCAGVENEKAARHICGVWFDGRAMMSTNRHMIAAVWFDAPELQTYDQRIVPTGAIRRLAKNLSEHRASDLCVKIRREKNGLGVDVVSRVDPDTKLQSYDIDWMTIDEEDPDVKTVLRWRAQVRDRSWEPAQGAASVGVDPKYMLRGFEVVDALETKSMLRTGAGALDAIQIDDMGSNLLPDGISRVAVVLAPIGVF